MAVHVHFCGTRNIGANNSGDLTRQAAPGLGVVRKRESIALAAVTTEAAKPGETIVIHNAEATSILVALGSTPDAAALTATSLTSAGYLLAAGATSPVFVPAVGDKVSAKVVS